MKKKDLYFDMDGVLCNFMKRYLMVKDLFGLEYPQSQMGFFSSLEPIKGAIEAFEKLRGCGKYNCYILTRPSIKNVHCYSEKAIWIRDHLGEEMLENMYIGCDKSKLKGDYLIDDVTEHGQTEFEGEHIHFGSDEFPTWNEVLEYLL